MDAAPGTLAQGLASAQARGVAPLDAQLLLLQTPGCAAALAIAQLANKIESTLLVPTA